MMHTLFPLSHARVLLLAMLISLWCGAGMGVAVADIPPGPPPNRFQPKSTPAEGMSPQMLLAAWLACGVLSLAVTFMLSSNGRAAAARDTPGTKGSAASRRRRAETKPTWRTFLLPFVWLPLPCMFIIFALGANQPLVLQLEKNNRSEIVGYSEKRNDPGWLASSNDMRESTSALIVSVSYAALGLITLNVCWLVLLTFLMFAARDPEEEPVVAGAGGGEGAPGVNGGVGAPPVPVESADAATSAGPDTDPLAEQSSRTSATPL